MGMIDYILGYWQLGQPPILSPLPWGQGFQSLVTCFAPILICRYFQFIYTRKVYLLLLT